MKWASITSFDPISSLTVRTAGVGHTLSAQVLAYFPESDPNKFRRRSSRLLASGDLYMGQATEESAGGLHPLKLPSHPVKGLTHTVIRWVCPFAFLSLAKNAMEKAMEMLFLGMKRLTRLL